MSIAPVAQAAFDGDVDAVRAWLAAGGDIDETFKVKSGQTSQNYDISSGEYTDVFFFAECGDITIEPINRNDLQKTIIIY